MEKLNSEKIFDNGKVVLVKETISSESTNEEYIYIKKQSAVLVLALHKEHVYFVRQKRHTVGQFSLELPGGRIEANETPVEAAVRELKEETGLVDPKTIERLGEFYPLLSVTNEKVYVFYMKGFKLQKQDLDKTEVSLTVKKLSLDKINQKFIENMISGPDMLALQLYLSSNFNPHQKKNR